MNTRSHIFLLKLIKLLSTKNSSSFQIPFCKSWLLIEKMFKVKEVRVKDLFGNLGGQERGDWVGKIQFTWFNPSSVDNQQEKGCTLKCSTWLIKLIHFWDLVCVCWKQNYSYFICLNWYKSHHYCLIHRIIFNIFFFSFISQLSEQVNKQFLFLIIFVSLSFLCFVCDCFVGFCNI